MRPPGGCASWWSLVAGLGLWGASRRRRAFALPGRRTGSRARSAGAATRSRSSGPRFARPATARGSRDLRAPPLRSHGAVRLVRAAGHKDDVGPAGSLGREHERLLGVARRLFGSTAADAVSGAETERGRVRRCPSSTRRWCGLSMTVRGSSADAWPDGRREARARGRGAPDRARPSQLAPFFLLRLAGYRRRLERARRDELARLEQAALTDSLTGLGNHRAFHEDLERELARRDRTGSRFSVVMLDLDGLKEINDTLGHGAGDDRLRAVAECLTSTLRRTAAPTARAATSSWCCSRTSGRGAR